LGAQECVSGAEEDFLSADERYTEPLIRETFGDAPTFDGAGIWEHRSYTSCAVGFTTNLPTITVIEYGENAAYGHVTTQSESCYYQHLHYIKGLESGKTYHYRYVAQDYDGITISSGDRTFTTKEITSDIIRIPEDMTGDAPYTLPVRAHTRSDRPHAGRQHQGKQRRT
jgi:hypothetical protein